MATQRASSVWADINGSSATTVLNTSAGVAAVNAALAAKSHAGIIQSWEGTLTATAPSATPGTYQSVRDAATLVFNTSSGQVLTVTLLAPDSSIFFADQESVDPAQIAGIIAAVVANVVSASGLPATGFVAGFRSSTPT